MANKEVLELSQIEWYQNSSKSIVRKSGVLELSQIEWYQNYC